MEISEDMIKEFAQPILDQILAYQENIGGEMLEKPLTVKLMCDDAIISLDEEAAVDTDEFLSLVEEYIQEELDQWYRPTVLN
jgi:hypothetical protein